MGDNQQYNYDIFNLYYESAQKAKERGDIKNAKRNLLLAANALLKMAQSEKGPLKAARIERAERLIAYAENMSENDVQTKKNGSSSVNKDSDAQQNDGGREWQAASIPDVKFSDVAGLEDVKRSIRVRMIDPIKYPDKYATYKKKTGGGVLLYGPPGTGKTMIAKAIANEVGAKFYAVKGSDIVSKWVGESEKNINSLFETARKDDLAIIFIDEMDSLFGQRGQDSHNDKRVNEFLQQIDGFVGKNPNLLLLGATNRPWDVDGAAVRSGRFSEKIYVTLPDASARKYLFKKQMSGLPLSEDIDVDRLVSLTENYSGADIAEICDLAKEEPLKRYIETDVKQNISMKDFLKAVSKVTPMVDKREIARFEEYAGLNKRGVEKPVAPSVENNVDVNRPVVPEVKPEVKKEEATFASETISIMPMKKSRIEFYLPNKHEKVYVELAGKHYVCSNTINNWACDVDVQTAGEYEAIISDNKEICRKTLKFVKGIIENDMDI